MTFRLKLLILTLVTVSIAQAIGGTIAAYLEMGRAAEVRQMMLIQTATLLASNLATPLAAGRTDELDPALSGVVRSGSVPHALVFDAEGLAVAEAGSTEQLSGTPVIRPGDPAITPLALIGARAIRAEVPVVKAGVEVGRVAVDGDVSDLPDQLRRTGLVSLSVTALTLAFALLISIRLQARLLRPLIDLSRTMGSIATDHRYDVPPVPAGDDEVGVLASSFNRMMVEIRDRDGKLLRHQARLEADVAERTADFRRATAEARPPTAPSPTSSPP